MEPSQNYPETPPPVGNSQQPAMPPQPQPSLPPEQPLAPMPLPKPHRKKRFWWLLLALLLSGGGVYGWYRYAPSTPLSTTAKPSLTLYYNDGKTVLWNDPNPAVEPTVQPAKAPYFVDLVRAELHKKFGDAYYKQGAWKVTTTLDASLQAQAEKLVADNVANLQQHTHGVADSQATILQDVTTGQIKALVGGTDRTNAEYGLLNFATTVRIQPGASVKPFDYAALMENTTNTGAGSVVSDSEGPMTGYPCTQKRVSNAEPGNCLQDYDFISPGDMPLRYALAGSRNIPAVKAADTVGLQKVIGLIKDAGVDEGYNCYASSDFTQTQKCYEAAALGDGAYLTLVGETHALATLANGGKKVPQTTIASVTLNGKAKNLGQSATKQVIKSDTAYIINDIMSDPNASYLPGSCSTTTCSSDASSYKFQRYNGWKFAVDSGITNNGFDAIMASWSSKYIVASWVGNHTRAQSIQSTGAPMETLTEPLTRGLMEAAHAGKTASNWSQPSDIKTLPAFVLTKHIHYGDVEPSPSTDLYPTWYKP